MIASPLDLRPPWSRLFFYRKSNRNLQTSKAPLESQAQSTSLFTSAGYISEIPLFWMGACPVYPPRVYRLLRTTTD